MWTLGLKYILQRDSKAAFPFGDGGPDKTAAIDTASVDIGLKLKTDVPDGR